MYSAAPPAVLPRAWYRATFDDFLRQSTAEVIGQLALRAPAVEADQRDA